MNSDKNLSFYELPTGKLEYRLTNDYLFRVLLQNSHKVLEGLVCSLLHLKPEQIHSLIITNPIKLGEAVSDKTFVLDVEVQLNSNKLINLEMQVINEGNWTDRSLSYLCRSFDRLCRGQDYRDTLTAIHIGILDFTLFPEHPEFYAQYKLLNTEKHYIFNDKFVLNVLDLNQTELATEMDKTYHLDYWAALFKATTWEDIRMLSSANEYMAEAARTIFEACTDADIRKQCEARERYERNMRRLATLEKENAELSNKVSSLLNRIAELENQSTDSPPST